MEVHQHVFFEGGLPVVDTNAVVMSVEAVDERLNGRLVQVTQVRRALAWLLSKHKRLWIDKSEGIDDNLALDGLDGVNNHGNGSRCQLFEGLLCVDIYGGKPATETRMGMVPANNSLRSDMKISSACCYRNQIFDTYRPVCRNMSIIFVWKTGSTASTLTPVPLCGMANTSTTRTVKSSTNSPSIKPITSIGTPALPCRSIFKSAREEM